MHIDVSAVGEVELVPVHPDEQLRLMHVHAHPDDESSKGAASTAMYVEQGVDVLVVTCTGGERGDILNPAMDTDEVKADLTAVRRAEMAAAAGALGIRHMWLGHIDSGFPDPDENGVRPLPDDCFAAADLSDIAPGLARVIRAERPHVVTTYDENGGYPHPDHIRCHEITVAAIALAADPNFDSDNSSAHAPWQVHKVYYHQSFHYARVKAMHEAMLAAGMPSRFEEWLANWDHSGDRVITTRVQCEVKHFEARDAALRAHATQIDPTVWLAVPCEAQHAVWSTEDFELAQTWVTVELPETDLFAGVRLTADTRTLVADRSE